MENSKVENFFSEKELWKTINRSKISTISKGKELNSDDLQRLQSQLMEVSKWNEKIT